MLSPIQVTQFVEQGYCVGHTEIDPDLARKAIDITWDLAPEHFRRDDPTSWQGAFTDSCHGGSVEARFGRVKWRECLRIPLDAREGFCGNRRMKLSIFAALAVAGGLSCHPFGGQALARTWTSSDGKEIEADFVGLEGDSVVLRMKGREYRLPLSKLSAADQKFARDQASPPPAPEGEEGDTPPATPGVFTFAGQTLTPGELAVVTISLSPENQALAVKPPRAWKSGYANGYPGEWLKAMTEGHAVTQADVLIGLPPSFDASAKQVPVFIQWTSTDTKSHVKGGRDLWNTLRDNGWILLSVDAHPDPGAAWSTSVFYANIRQALEELRKSWPQSTAWPVAVGGFSGGAKLTQSMGPLIAELEGVAVKGLWLGGCNESLFDYALQDLAVKRSTPRTLKVYMSSGTNDDLVNEGHRKAVESDCKAAGVRHLRSETYEGGHEINHAQLAEALAWFLEPDGK